MKRLLTLLATLFLIVGCGHEPKFVGVYDFTPQSWEQGQNVVFDFQTLRTQKTGDIRFALRYLPSAVGQRVSLTFKTADHTNLFHIDSLNFTLARGAGEAIRSVEMVVRRDVMWTTSAPHYITITPRSDVADVVSIALIIQNATY